MSLSRIVKSKGIYFTSCYLFYENTFPGRNNDPFSNAQSSSFFHLLVISSHELSHSIVSNTLFPNVLSTKSDPTYPDMRQSSDYIHLQSSVNLLPTLL